MSEEGLRSLMRQSAVWKKKQNAFEEAAALLKCSFDRDNGSVPQLAEARRYAEHFTQLREQDMGLLLWGPCGSGKTFAAACIANAMCEQLMDVRMTTLGAFLSRLPGLTPREKNIYLTALIECDLLILDDFGMERRTDFAQEQVFRLIDGRCLSRKPLIVTTNLSLHELKDTGELSRRRIYDRILEKCVPVCFDGDSLRAAAAKEHLARYRSLTRAESSP